MISTTYKFVGLLLALLVDNLSKDKILGSIIHENLSQLRSFLGDHMKKVLFVFLFLCSCATSKDLVQVIGPKSNKGWIYNQAQEGRITWSSKRQCSRSSCLVKVDFEYLFQVGNQDKFVDFYLRKKLGDSDFKVVALCGNYAKTYKGKTAYRIRLHKGEKCVVSGYFTNYTDFNKEKYFYPFYSQKVEDVLGISFLK